jgi:hypothetical protein
MSLEIIIADKATHVSTSVATRDITLASPSVVELPIPREQVKSLSRHGDNLVINTEDGQSVVLHGFFTDGAHGQNDLVLQDADGLWYADLSSLNGLIDTIEDATSSDHAVDQSVLSPIDSIDPLLDYSADVTASANNTDNSALAETPTAAGADAAGSGTSTDTDANTGTATDTSADLTGHGVLSWLPLISGVGIIAAAASGGNSAHSDTSSLGAAADATTPDTPLVDMGKSTFDSTGDATQINLTGTADPNATVIVTAGDSTQTVAADATGAWSAQIASSSAPYLSVTSADAAGNVSGTTFIGLTGASQTLDMSGGKDTFVLRLLADDASGGNGITTLSHFTVGDYSSTANADRIDVSQLLVSSGYTGDVSTLGQYLTATPDGADTTISIDRDGSASAYAPTPLITLTGVTNMTVTDLLAHQQLVLA